MTEEMSQTAAGSAAIRLQKYLAEAGVASRRSCEQLILDGRVQVNGTVVTQLGTKVVPEKDEITLDGKLVLLEEGKQYLLLYKPVGVLSSVSDDRGRKTVIDLLPGVAERVYPVGRLDYDTEGLLLLTNDGALTNLLIHPRHEIKKTYLATIEGTPSAEDLHQLTKGILLSDGMTAPAKVKLAKSRGAHTLLEITIHEGRNRQVRRMCAAIGHPVQALKRVQMGPITLGDLQVGQWRHLTAAEVAALWSSGKRKRG
jgi:23S rRNA pseudouridine2605 synthase